MQEHPRRRDLIDELHARPFAEVSAPCDVVFLACKHPENAVGRDRAGERDRLTDRLRAAGLDPHKVGTNHSRRCGDAGQKTKIGIGICKDASRRREAGKRDARSLPLC